MKRGLALCIALLLLALPFAGCGGQSLRCDVAYGDDSPRQALDYALPRPRGNEAETKAFLFIHGGSWSSGDKADYAEQCKTAAKSGYVAATMNYRLLGDGAGCFDMLADIGAAVAALDSLALAAGVEITGLTVVGGSAGGHLGLLYSYIHALDSPIPIELCVGLAAPADFTDYNLYPTGETGVFFLDRAGALLKTEITADIHLYKELLLSISPIHYVTPDSPPTILAHGARDELVPYSNAARLLEALEQNGVRCELFRYENSDHALADDPETDQAMWAAVYDFVA